MGELVNEANTSVEGNKLDENELAKELQNLALQEKSKPVQREVHEQMVVHHVPSKLPKVHKTVPSKSFGLYGFANRYKDKLNTYDVNLSAFLNLEQPETTPIHIRKTLCEEEDKHKFDVEHYMADFFLQNDGDDSPIIDIMQYKPYWYNVKRIEDIVYTQEEIELLNTFPNEPIVLKHFERNKVQLSLVDILCAYAYDYRTTMGEHSCESAWNIVQLSGTFSWFLDFVNIEETCLFFLRRSLCYPIYRHWRLSKRALKDVIRILKVGRKLILKCLLSVYSILSEDEDRYILNELYLKDYILWIQQVEPEVIHNIAENIKNCIIFTKEDVGLNLKMIENKYIATYKKEDPEGYLQWQAVLQKLPDKEEERSKPLLHKHDSDADIYPFYYTN